MSPFHYFYSRSLEQEMATHSSILAWKSPPEKSGGLQSKGSQTVGFS